MYNGTLFVLKVVCLIKQCPSVDNIFEYNHDVNRIASTIKRMLNRNQDIIIFIFWAHCFLSNTRPKVDSYWKKLLKADNGWRETWDGKIVVIRANSLGCLFHKFTDEIFASSFVAILSGNLKWKNVTDKNINKTPSCTCLQDFKMLHTHELFIYPGEYRQCKKIIQGLFSIF